MATIQMRVRLMTSQMTKDCVTSSLPISFLVRFPWLHGVLDPPEVQGVGNGGPSSLVDSWSQVIGRIGD